jgi:hypothetical protein
MIVQPFSLYQNDTNKLLWDPNSLIVVQSPKCLYFEYTAA